VVDLSCSWRKSNGEELDEHLDKGSTGAGNGDE